MERHPPARSRPPLSWDPPTAAHFCRAIVHHQPALNIGIAVDVSLGRLNRPVPGKNLNVPEGPADLVDLPRGASDECSGGGPGRPARPFRNVYGLNLGAMKFFIQRNSKLFRSINSWQFRSFLTSWRSSFDLDNSLDREHKSARR